jgi:hypothetical protein
VDLLLLSWPYGVVCAKYKKLLMPAVLRKGGSCGLESALVLSGCKLIYAVKKSRLGEAPMVKVSWGHSAGQVVIILIINGYSVAVEGGLILHMSSAIFTSHCKVYSVLSSLLRLMRLCQFHPAISYLLNNSRNPFCCRQGVCPHSK